MVQNQRKQYFNTVFKLRVTKERRISVADSKRELSPVDNYMLVISIFIS